MTVGVGERKKTNSLPAVAGDTYSSSNQGTGDAPKHAPDLGKESTGNIAKA